MRYTVSVPLAHRDPRDPGQTRFNQEVTTAVRALSQIPWLDAVLVEVDVTASATRVLHGMGRPVAGWMVVRKDATGDVWETDAPAGAPDDANREFYVIGSGSLTVTLLVF